MHQSTMVDSTQRMADDKVTKQSSTEMVTVVIPFCETYTQREMLQEAIESVEQQAAVDTEVLVIEDTEERGPAWGRNVGLERAETRYVAFLDADDTWKQTKLRDQLQRMTETGAGLCVDGDHQYSAVEFVGALMRSEIFGLTSAIIVDTDQVSTRFDESLERREDHLFMMEAAMEGGVCFLPQTFNVRNHEQGLSNHVDLSPQQITEFYTVVTTRIPDATQFRQPYYQTEYVYLGRRNHHDGNYLEAIRYYVRSLTYGLSIPAFGAIALTIIAVLYTYLIDPVRKFLTSNIRTGAPT